MLHSFGLYSRTETESSDSAWSLGQEIHSLFFELEHTII